MELDKTQATAIAAFRRFDADVHDPLLRAVSAAFGLIACADGELDPREIHRYVEVASGDTRFEKLDRPQLEHALDALVEALTTDIDGGRERALAILIAHREVPEDRDLILASARIALMADEKWTSAELDAMRTICATLGVPARAYLPED